jgi:hypothetical protein
MAPEKSIYCTPFLSLTSLGVRTQTLNCGRASIPGQDGLDHGPYTLVPQVVHDMFTMTHGAWPNRRWPSQTIRHAE